MNVETAVHKRYSQGAEARQKALCCPVSYDKDLLELLPEEIIEKDYGCGDPSRYVKEGDTVLDLGSGGGKICYMAAQLVGSAGSVTGVDMNDDMLALARKYQSHMVEKLGSNRIRFLKGRIQDLALDVEALDVYLDSNPVNNGQDYVALQAWEDRQRMEKPLIADNSIGLVISNCVLNLVDDREKLQLVSEIYRVLKPGGRVAISDIVSDKPVPKHLKSDGELWSGCISGVFREREFLDAFAAAGFQAVCYDMWDEVPWRVVEQIEFRSITLTAVKPESPTDALADKSVVYRGPFSEITLDSSHHFIRGVRTRVPADLHQLLMGPHYQASFIDVSTETASPSAGCCGPAVTKDSGNGGNGGCC
jgi:ubiquinone/menaquinone biosynthesis C-methylase UbiE